MSCAVLTGTVDRVCVPCSDGWVVDLVTKIGQDVCLKCFIGSRLPLAMVFCDCLIRKDFFRIEMGWETSPILIPSSLWIRCVC